VDQKATPVSKRESHALVGNEKVAVLQSPPFLAQAADVQERFGFELKCDSTIHLDAP
jgi:hypothetical protein